MKKLSKVFAALLASAAMLQPISVFSDYEPEAVIIKDSDVTSAVRIVEAPEAPAVPERTEFLNKDTESFLNQIRNHSEKLYYTGSRMEAKYALSEVACFYCDLEFNITFWYSADPADSYIILDEPNFDTLYTAVKYADQKWMAYDRYVEDLAHTITDYGWIDSVNVDYLARFITDEFEYKVTNKGMPDFLETRTGQCWHYSKLFADVCSAMGIEAKKVENDVHAWNEVTVYGKTYKFDLSSNDFNKTSAFGWVPVE